MDIKVTLPLLPLRDIVVFPSMVIPLFVGRDKSITALNEVMKGDKKILKLMTQRKMMFSFMVVKVISYSYLNFQMELLKY